MENIKFSVVTVCYNDDLRLSKTIESVLNQSYAPYEYIIIDGGSTDNTLSLIKGYEKEFNSRNIRFIYVSEKDEGIYNAMNKGIDASTGDFISFINAGDWYERGALESVKNLFDLKCFDFCYGAINYYKKDGTMLVKKSKKDRVLVTSRHWNHPSMFVKSNIYKENRFDENYRIYADFELFLRIRRQYRNIAINKSITTNFVADGISTNTDKKVVTKRAKEKYKAYRENKYSRLYWFESYGWEKFKSFYFRMHREK